MKEIKQLLKITQKLKTRHNRGFTLDGKLVGHIGEVLVAQEYNVMLLKEQSKVHDAVENETGRMVQIKSSFKDSFYFPHKSKIPDYIIFVHIEPDGSIVTRYNGPGQLVFDILIANRIKGDSTGYVLSTRKLMELFQSVPEDEKISLRK